MIQPEKMSGSVKECLLHYLEHGILQSLADYMETEPAKLQGWKESLPKGWSFWQIAYFLTNEGYKVLELSALPPAIRDIGRLAFARILTVDGFVEKHSDIISSRESFLDMFKRPEKRGPLTLARLQKIYTDFLLSHGEILNNSSGRITPLVRTGSKASKPAIPEASKASVPKGVDAVAINMDKETALRSFAVLIELAMPIGSVIVSDQFTEKDRHKLRTELLSGGRLTRFSDVMNRLTSERAREEFKTATKRKEQQ